MNKEKIKDIIIGILLAIIIILIIVTGIVERKKTVEKNDNDTITEIDNETDTTDIDSLNYLAIGASLYDKLNEMYEVKAILPYCGFSTYEIHALPTENFGTNVTYYKTPFANIEELKSYISNFTGDLSADNFIYSSDIITDITSLDENELHNYIIYDNSLYCRGEARKGYLSKYISYEITITNIEDNKVEYNIKSSYEGDNSEVIYKNKPFVILRDTNTYNWYVSEFNFHGSVYDAD